jgi:hypothetical protein
MAAMAILEDVQLSSGAIENADCLIIIHLLIKEGHIKLQACSLTEKCFIDIIKIHW